MSNVAKSRDEAQAKITKILKQLPSTADVTDYRPQGYLEEICQSVLLLCTAITEASEGHPAMALNWDSPRSNKGHAVWNLAERVRDLEQKILKLTSHGIDLSPQAPKDIDALLKSHNCSGIKNEDLLSFDPAHWDPMPKCNKEALNRLAYEVFLLKNNVKVDVVP